MPDNTIFPGILITELKIQQGDIPEPGVIKEFGPRGLTTEFEPAKMARDFSPDIVQDLIKNFAAWDDDYWLEYRLQVQAAMARSAKMKARAFVRVKNPFEADLINVHSVKKDEDMSGDKLGNVYNVRVRVNK